MGAVRMRVQTADKNITIIHTTPVYQLISCEVKSCMFFKSSIQIQIIVDLLVDYCDVFISCLDSHSDGTHSLQNGTFLQICDEETISSTSCMTWGGVHFQKNFYFWVNYSFKNSQNVKKHFLSLLLFQSSYWLSFCLQILLFFRKNIFKWFFQTKMHSLDIFCSLWRFTTTGYWFYCIDKNNMSINEMSLSVFKTGFGMTWKWVNVDRILIFVWTILLTAILQTYPEILHLF